MRHWDLHVRIALPKNLHVVSRVAVEALLVYCNLCQCQVGLSLSPVHLQNVDPYISSLTNQWIHIFMHRAVPVHFIIWVCVPIIFIVRTSFFLGQNKKFCKFKTVGKINLHSTEAVYTHTIRPKKKIGVFTVTRPTLIFASDPMHFTQNSDNHFCCLTSSNVLFIQLLAFCRNWEQRR